MSSDVRLLLPWILLVGIVGVSAELVLLAHTEDTLQWIPLIALSVGAAATVWTLARPSRAAVIVLSLVMVAFVLSGVLGIVLHYRGNVEFELEMYPSMGGFELVWEALTGATPALAPGSMALLGLIGGVYAFRHPLLTNETD